MRVTDEMVERAARSMREDFALKTEDAARAALEAALAPLPEPSQDPVAEASLNLSAALAQADIWRRRAQAAEAQLEAAEAQLAKVRALAEEGLCDAILDILDGEP